MEKKFVYKILFEYCNVNVVIEYIICLFVFFLINVFFIVVYILFLVIIEIENWNEIMCIVRGIN